MLNQARITFYAPNSGKLKLYKFALAAKHVLCWYKAGGKNVLVCLVLGF